MNDVAVYTLVNHMFGPWRTPSPEWTQPSNRSFGSNISREERKKRTATRKQAKNQRRKSRG